MPISIHSIILMLPLIAIFCRGSHDFIPTNYMLVQVSGPLMQKGRMCKALSLSTKTHEHLAFVCSGLQSAFTPRSNDSAVVMGFERLQYQSPVMETWHPSEHTSQKHFLFLTVYGNNVQLFFFFCNHARCNTGEVRELLLLRGEEE